jgi:hypothetical protein
MVRRVKAWSWLGRADSPSSECGSLWECETVESPIRRPRWARRCTFLAVVPRTEPSSRRSSRRLGQPPAGGSSRLPPLAGGRSCLLSSQAGAGDTREPTRSVGGATAGTVKSCHGRLGYMLASSGPDWVARSAFHHGLRSEPAWIRKRNSRAVDIRPNDVLWTAGRVRRRQKPA